MTDVTRILIDAFIVVYLFLAWAWRQPHGTLGHAATEPIARFVQWIGLAQDWSMFTPDPPFTGADLQVIVKLESGAAILWEPPRMEALSRRGAFRFFRYRAYANAMMSSWAIAGQPTLADYLVRKYESNGDRPVEVVYTWIERPIAPPGETVAPPPARSIFLTVRVPEATS